MNITIDINTEEAAILLKAKCAAAQAALSKKALDDCNKYCRMQSRKLSESSYKSSNISTGELVWEAQYARRVYYLGNPLKKVNPKASLLWAHKAANIHGAEWLALVRKIFAERKE